MGGVDKARVELHGAPLLVHVVGALAPGVSQVQVIGRVPDGYADLGLTTLIDLCPGAGPISGLHRALSASDPGGPPILLTACDLYGVDIAWVGALWAQARAVPEALAVAFCGQPADAPATGRNPRRWEPLLALYSPRLLPAVEARIACGDNALWRLLDACGALPVSLPPHWGRLVVINTPADLARAEARAS
jgi:molybdopterin-guanine dinucleotide biosynthesis protein A